MATVTCNFCDLDFQTRIKHQNHVTKVHQNETLKFKCDVCEKHLESLKELDHHQYSIHKITKYVCDICNKCFGWKKNMM